MSFMLANLSSRDLSILRYIELSAWSSVSEVADALSIREHIVRRVIKRALQIELITPRVFIDTFRLGFTRYAILFSLAASSEKQVSRIVSHIASSGHVSVFLELAGEFQFEVDLVARSAAELASILEWISNECGGQFFDKEVSIQTDHAIFGTKQIAPSAGPVRQCGFAAFGPVLQIDELDHNILVQLTANGCASTSQIARILGSPLSSVDARISRLKKAGVIVGYTYELRGSMLGLQNYVLYLQARGMSENVDRKVQEFAKNHPNVTYFIKNIGGWDYQLGVAVRDNRIINSIIQEVYREIGQQISAVRIQQMIRAVKVEDYPMKEFKNSSVREWQNSNGR